MHATKEQRDKIKPILKRADYLTVQNHGKKWVSHGLMLQVKGNDFDYSRAGFTVTKRTEKKAVGRNRIKRRLRAVAADILPLYAKKSHDYILVGRAETAKRPYQTLCQDLKWCLKKMDLYVKDQQ